MIAMGIVLSATAGRIRCLSVSPSTLQLAVMIELKTYRLAKKFSELEDGRILGQRPAIDIIEGDRTDARPSGVPEGGSQKGVSFSTSAKK